MTPADVQQVGSLSSAPARSQFPWIPILWFAGLLGILFGPVLATMVKEWSTDESMGHGFFVPVVAAYIIWQRRDALLALPLKGHWTGWIGIILGFVFLLLGTLGADFFVMRMGFMSALFGVVLATCGWAIIKELAFPLFLLLFMIRIPLFIYSQITFPLQLFASRVAEIALTWLDIPVLREGNVLELPSQKLNVVEACSGIRSLLSLAFLSLVYGYFFEARLLIRILLLILTIPIAIAANAIRVTLTGIMSEFNPDFASGIYHALEGWGIFVIALAALLFSHRILTWIIPAPRTPAA